MVFCDVSVIIPNYNRTTFLYRALQSVSGQSSPPREVIIVDDYSDHARFNDIQKIIKRFSSRLNIIVLRNPSNMGANYSRNRGIDAATQKYIAFLDSDDLWMPSKLERQVAAMEEGKRRSDLPVLCYTGRYRVDKDAHIITRQYGGRGFSADKMRRSNLIGTLSSVVLDANIARAVGGFNELLPACQDWDLFLRLADKVQFIGLKEALCIYVDHDEERITLNHRKRLKAHFYIYRTYIKPSGDLDEVDRAEFLRNVAGDFQALGMHKKATLFYVRYLRARATQRFLGQTSLLLRSLYFHAFGIPNIKERRYRLYRKHLQSLQKDEGVRRQIQNDQALITEMACIGEIEFLAPSRPA